MAFENISKGEFTRSGWKVVDESDDDLICCNGRQYEENAEFIAYCFNLQQRYDISKFEEAVKALEFVLEKDGYKFIAELLREIKK